MPVSIIRNHIVVIYRGRLSSRPLLATSQYDHCIVTRRKLRQLHLLAHFRVRGSVFVNLLGMVNSGQPSMGDRKWLGTPTGLKRDVASSRYRGEICSIGIRTMVLRFSRCITAALNQDLYTSRRSIACSCASADIREDRSLVVLASKRLTVPITLGATYHCQRTGGLTYGVFPKAS